MYDFLDGLPFWVVYLCLLGIIVARAQATYWIGRGIGAGVHGGGLARRLGPRLDRAERLVGRYGPPAVTLSFVTVGIQTAVNLSAGAMRMAFGRYLIAMFIGCLAWALIYSLGGLAVLGAWWGLFTRAPLSAAVLILLVLAVAVAVFWYRRRAGRSGSGDRDTGEAVPEASVTGVPEREE